MKKISNPTLRTLLVLGAIAVVMPTVADAQITLCRDIAASDSKKAQVQCDLRATEDVTVKGVKVSGDGRSSEATYKANNAAEPPAAILILLDQNESIDRNGFNRLRSVLSRIIDPAAKGLSFGVYGFSRDLKEIAPVGTSPATIKLAVESIARQGRASEGLRSIVDVLPKLIAAPGDRKILIILSDGRFDDPAYSVNEVSAKLKQANVTVMAVAPGNAPDDVTDAQTLRRLAQDTFGEFLTAQNQSAAENVVRRLKSFLTFGGTISFEPIAPEMKIEADIQGGKAASTTYKTELTPVAPEVSSVPPGLKPKESFSPKNLYNAFLAWLQDGLRNHLIFAGGVLAVVVILVLLAKFVSNRRQESEAALPPEMGVVQPESYAEIRPVFGWLEFLDGNQTREPIRSRATRLGRSSDNDIVLKNTSVHRQHAVIKEDPTGGLVIVDMDTNNGVIVNGERIKSAAKLNQGDVIELGEVRMRFSQPQPN